MRAPLRVLNVEDTPDDSELLLRELRRGSYNPVIERVDTAAAMKAALEKQNWDFVICDYRMPNFNAFEALAVLQQSGQDLPFVIVSGTIGEETAVAAMKAGAHDYLMKGNLTRLNACVEREVREAEERRARRASQAEERRLHRELEEQHRQLEQRVLEVTALNRMFQEHLNQRYAVIEAYQELCKELQVLAKGLDSLAERARSQPISDLQDLMAKPDAER